MSDCNHVWRAVNSRASQCSKCGEIERSPCGEPDCVTMQARINELEKDNQRLRLFVERCMTDGYLLASQRGPDSWPNK